MSKNITDVLTTLAYLMGERTVQSSTTAVRTNFIQKTLEEIYRAYKWPFAQVNASLAVNAGVASLASNFDYQHGITGYFYQGTLQTPLEPIATVDQSGYNQGDYRYWLEPQTDGTFLFKTKDTTYSAATFQYQAKAPTLTAVVATPFDDDMTIALGARRYIKLSQDPNADISQDEALFQKRLTENMAATQVANPKRRIRFLGHANGHRMGGGYDEGGQVIRFAG
jgi:hypothetical protein